jgi:hypothetical protein
MQRMTKRDWLLLIAVTMSGCDSRDEGAVEEGDTSSTGSMESADGSDGSSSGSSSGGPSLPPDPSDSGPCSNGPLEYGPLELPSGTLDERYDVSLLQQGDSQWGGWGYGLSSGELPPGLELSTSDARLSGEPTATGVFEFVVEAYNEPDDSGCSTHPDPHAFVLHVVEPEADPEPETDG